jgi:uroporphyrinogen decarboxylase
MMASAGADVVGVDWRVPLNVAAERVGPDVALQGNLDPAICLAPVEVVTNAAEKVLDEAAGLPGHVFNLGHGVLPETDPGVLQAVVELVHDRTARAPKDPGAKRT